MSVYGENGEFRLVVVTVVGGCGAWSDVSPLRLSLAALC